MFEWPENVLPLPSYEFTVDNDYSNIGTRMDSGRRRQRPRFTRSVDTASVAFNLTKAEYAIFRGIWDYELNNGNDWFMMRVPVANNESLTLSEIRFTSDFQATHQAFENWQITAEIEWQEADKISEDDLFDLLNPPPTEPVPANVLTYAGEDLHFGGNYLTSDL